jgi:hypothetical protein
VFFYASSSQLFVTVYMETAFDKKIIWCLFMHIHPNCL